MLDAIRVTAAERKTTVNQLVRLHLEQIARTDKRAIADLRRMSRKTEARLGPDDVFDRAGIYER